MSTGPEVISSVITAVGTLVLAVATFVSTRTANRATRVAERSLLTGLRPVLVHARLDDPAQKVGFQDDRWFLVEGSTAAFEVGEEAVYLVIPVRNVGSGIAVLQAWEGTPERARGNVGHGDPEAFRRLTRDIYVAPGDIGFWQGAYRDPGEPMYEAFAAAALERRPVTIDVLYSDLHGGQRTITRFSIIPGDDGQWISTAGLHWTLDGTGPR